MEGLRHTVSEKMLQSMLSRTNGVRIRVFGPKLRAIGSFERREYLQPSRSADTAVGRLPVRFTGSGIVRAISIAIFKVIGQAVAVVVQRRTEEAVACVDPNLVGVGVTGIVPG